MDEIESAAPVAVGPRTARPPREWEMQTLVLMAAVAFCALLGMLLLVSDLAIRSYVLSGGVNGLSPLVRWIVDNWDSISGLFLLLGLGYLVGFAWWRRRTRDMLHSVGDQAGRPVEHWTVMAWYLALAVSFMIRVFDDPTGGKESDLAIWLLWDAAQNSVRVIGLAFLLIAVWQIREQVHAQVARSGVMLRIQDMAPRRSAIPLSPAARPTPPAPPSGDLSPADDDFWRRVAGLATGLRTDVALLETTDSVARRWLLVPASGDLSAVRSALSAGAVLTAFPQPPAATETKGFTPLAADEYHGFLEDDESGALWYQSVKPNRVGAFLARARRARRWALYPANSPDALSAVVKPAET